MPSIIIESMPFACSSRRRPEILYRSLRLSSRSHGLLVVASAVAGPTGGVKTHPRWCVRYHSRSPLNAGIVMRYAEGLAHDSRWSGAQVRNQQDPDVDGAGALGAAMNAVWKRVPYWNQPSQAVPTLVEP
jgi:hypothetical protein